ncbi:ribonuclease III [Acanthopleuribacter pedis]
MHTVESYLQILLWFNPRTNDFLCVVHKTARISIILKFHREDRRGTQQSARRTGHNVPVSCRWQLRGSPGKIKHRPSAFAMLDSRLLFPYDRALELGVVMDRLEEIIQYRFDKKELLLQALTHSSYGYERSVPHNERLEFLGDSILGYVVSRNLYLQFPNKNEGTLSKLKSVLVSSKTLARKAKEIQLGEVLRLGRGERKAGGHKKTSILADAVEALIGAVSLDGGLDKADELINVLFGEDIANATIEIKNAVDFKTLLQEKLQEQGLGLPKYILKSEEGPAHSRVFRVCAEVGGYAGPVGEGTSKKNAQQESARLLLDDTNFWNEVESNQAVQAK